jgi:hypothetical protein
MGRKWRVRQQAKPDYAKWVAAVLPVAGAAASAASLPGSDIAFALLDLILGANDAQDELLSSIKADTQLIRGTDLATAKLLLGEAKRTEKDSVRSRQFVEQARNHLYRAMGACKNDAERAVVQRQLAFVYLTLGLVEDAQHWFSESLQSSRSAVAELVRNAQRDTQHRKLRYVDGRAGQTPPTIGIRDFAFQWAMNGSPATNVIGILALIAAGLRQGVRAVRNAGKPSSVETLTDFVRFHNDSIVLASPFGVSTDRQMLMFRKEMTFLAEPAFMVRFVPASSFKTLVDDSLDRDPDLRTMRSALAFRMAISRELLGALGEGFRELRSELRSPPRDPEKDESS